MATTKCIVYQTRSATTALSDYCLLATYSITFVLCNHAVCVWLWVSFLSQSSRDARALGWTYVDFEDRNIRTHTTRNVYLNVNCFYLEILLHIPRKSHHSPPNMHKDKTHCCRSMTYKYLKMVMGLQKNDYICCFCKR